MRRATCVKPLRLSGMGQGHALKRSPSGAPDSTPAVATTQAHPLSEPPSAGRLQESYPNADVARVPIRPRIGPSVSVFPPSTGHTTGGEPAQPRRSTGVFN